MKLPHPAQVFSFWSMVAFLTVLTVGFVYEWKKGALEWE
jgi:NADH-quinone oxidoreductase subunit A